MRIRLIGGGRIVAKLQAAAQAGPAMVIQTLGMEAEIVMTASKQMYVPVETGTLRASGFVEGPTPTATGAEVTLGFGGPSAPYAVIVHEDLTKRHPVGQAKYLQIPLLARIAGMAAVLKQRVADGIRQSFQRLGKIEQNVRAGRPTNWGMPLFRGE